MHSCYHAGDLGDVVYSLYVLHKLRNLHLTLGTRTCLQGLQPRTGITWQLYMQLVPLLRGQPCIARLDWNEQPPFAVDDLNEFRLYWRGDFRLPPIAHLLEMYCARFNVPFDAEEPWLVADAERVASVVLARSPRQHNWDFPWPDVVKRYGREAVFVGLPEEYEAFCGQFDPECTVRYQPTPHLWKLACVINGCDLFIGNSSMPLAIAEGLKKNVVQEISKTTVEEAHTAIERKGAVNWRKPGDPLEVRA